MEVQNVRIDLISPSPLNPRKTFDEAAFKSLQVTLRNKAYCSLSLSE